jgi:UDP-N-acetylmuramoyl-L-alanyl-D-glutamate--2,6-diaminopimelate ligase
MGVKNYEFIEILKKDQLLSFDGNEDEDVLGISIDSRNVQKGFCYFAIKGSVADGHQYIPQAIEKGATSIVCQDLPNERTPNILYVQVKDCRKSASMLAHHFYGSPSTKLNVVGITGTNGKTSIATLLYQLFMEMGNKCGLISTVENRIGEVIIPSTHTTPDAISLAKLMFEMVNSGCKYIFMEVSSHALEQHRVGGIDFKVAIFSNLSHDHLDYHGSFLNYINAKKMLFDQLSSTAYSIINIDDKNGKTMIQNTTSNVITYALNTIADYHTRLISDEINGLQLRLDNEEVFFSMSGAFNAYNLTAVYAAARVLGMPKDDVLRIMSSLKGAEGRMEKVIQEQGERVGIVDYAHTPDALENVLTTIKASLKSNQQIVTVVGCGGDRDKTKRPIMGKIAANLSHKVIFTSDNPRSENTEEILNQILEGVNVDHVSKCLRIADRYMAIKTAVMISSPGDVILVAGKGHEKTQEINGVKMPFEDKKVLSEVFSGHT